MGRPRASWRHAAIVVALLCASVVASSSSAVAAPEDLCADQIAALEAINAQIDAHNAQPHQFTIPDQAAQAEAYDAEAARLNAAGDAAQANVQACADAMEALAAQDVATADLPTVPDDVKADIDAAKKQIPDDWKPSARPPAGQNWRIPTNSPVRPLYNVLRDNNPGPMGNAVLRGPRPTVDQRDPAYPASDGRVFGTNASGLSAASPDHIIPLAEIINMANFTKLSAQNMYAVTRAPLNYQWLSYTANLSKQARSAADMSGVDPAWQESQVQLENEVRQQLQDIINKLLKSQG